MALNRSQKGLIGIFALSVTGCATVSDKPGTGQPHKLDPSCQIIINEVRALKEEGSIHSFFGFAAGGIETMEDAKHWLQSTLNTGWGATEKEWDKIRALNNRLYIMKGGGMYTGIAGLFDKSKKRKTEYACLPPKPY